jgi:hypothetical protein
MLCFEATGRGLAALVGPVNKVALLAEPAWHYQCGIWLVAVDSFVSVLYFS